MTTAVRSSNIIRRNFNPPPVTEVEAQLENCLSLPPSQLFISKQQPSQESQTQQLPSPTIDEDEAAERALAPYCDQLKETFKKKNIKGFLLLLSKMEDLKNLKLDKHLLSKLGFKEDEETSHALEILSEGLFGSDKSGFTFALEVLLDSTPSEEEHRVTTLAILHLCKEFDRLGLFKFKLPSKDIPVEHILKEAEDTLTNKVISQQAQMDLFSNALSRYYVYNKEPHTLEPIFQESYDDSNKNKLVELINSQELLLKRLSHLAKKVNALNSKKLFNSPETLALAFTMNLANDMTPFTDRVVGHTPGTDATLAQDGAGFAFNTGCFITTAVFSALWRDHARKKNPGKTFTDLQNFIAKSLEKSLHIYKKVGNNPKAAKELESRVKKYNAKFGSPFWYKLTKICKLRGSNRSHYLYSNVPGRQTRKIQKHPLLVRQDFQKLSVQTPHFSHIKIFKNAFNHLRTDKNLTRFIELLSTYQDKEYANLFKTPFKINNPFQNHRLNLIQHLFTLYSLYPELSEENKSKITKLIKGFTVLESTVETTPVQNFFSENKKIIEKTTWQNRTDALSTVHQINLNILNKIDIPVSEKKFFIRCLIEKLEERENGQMAGLLERRKTFQIELGIALAGYLPYATRRILPLLSHAGVPQTDLTKALFGDVGWILSTFAHTGLNYSSITDSTTFKSILSSLRGTLTSLEDSKNSSASTPYFLEQNVNTIHAILNKIGDKKDVPENFSRYILDILSQTKKNYGDEGVSFMLEHKLGRKKPLLFELLKRFPKSEKENLFKSYFSKNDFLQARGEIKDYENDFDKFNQFLTQGIEKTKYSKNECALFAFKARAYLYHLFEDAKRSPEKMDIYKNCKKALDEAVVNIRIDRHSKFNAMTKRSLKTSFAWRSLIRGMGLGLWGLSTAASAAASVGLVALCLGVNIALPGIGLAVSIIILAACGILRSMFGMISNDHPFVSSINTNIDPCV